VSVAKGTFDVELVPGPAELGGAVSRYELVKTFQGDFVGTGKGVMLWGGDPSIGEAGYVAIELVTGVLNGREGSFLLQQFGTMSSGSHDLRSEVVPGSGLGEVVGISGTLNLVIAEDGTHFYELNFEL